MYRWCEGEGRGGNGRNARAVLGHWGKNVNRSVDRRDSSECVCEGRNETVTAASCSQVELRFFMDSIDGLKVKRAVAKDQQMVAGETNLSSASLKDASLSGKMNMTNSPYKHVDAAT